MKRSISIPTDTLWQAGFLLLPPTHRRLAHAVYLRRPALGHALSGAAGQRPVHRPAVLAPVWSDRAHRPLLHRHPHRLRCVGRGQLLCPVLPGHPHPALGSLSALGTAADVAGELPLYAHVADAGGRRPGGGPGCVPPSGETQGPPAPHRNAAAPAAGVGGGGAGLPLSFSPPGGGGGWGGRTGVGDPAGSTVLAAAWRYSSATRSSSRWRSRRTSRRSGWNRSWPAWSRRSRRRFPWSGPILWPS